MPKIALLNMDLNASNPAQIKIEIIRLNQLGYQIYGFYNDEEKQNHALIDDQQVHPISVCGIKTYGVVNNKPEENTINADRLQTIYKTIAAYHATADWNIIDGMLIDKNNDESWHIIQFGCMAGLDDVKCRRREHHSIRSKTKGSKVLAYSGKIALGLEGQQVSVIINFTGNFYNSLHAALQHAETTFWQRYNILIKSTLFFVMGAALASPLFLTTFPLWLTISACGLSGLLSGGIAAAFSISNQKNEIQKLQNNNANNEDTPPDEEELMVDPQVDQLWKKIRTAQHIDQAAPVLTIVPDRTALPSSDKEPALINRPDGETNSAYSPPLAFKM